MTKKQRLNELQDIVDEACQNRDFSFGARANVIELKVLQALTGKISMRELRACYTPHTEDEFKLFLKLHRKTKG